MVNEFFALVDSAQPSLDPELVKRLRDRRIDRGELEADFFATQLPEKPCQGEVLGPLPFYFHTDEG